MLLQSYNTVDVDNGDTDEDPEVEQVELLILKVILLRVLNWKRRHAIIILLYLQLNRKLVSRVDA